MKKHVKTYLDYFDIGPEDVWVCEICGRRRHIADLEIHHIRFKSQGGGDNLDNLICLCRRCHDKVHSKGMKVDLSMSIIDRS